MALINTTLGTDTIAQSGTEAWKQSAAYDATYDDTTVQGGNTARIRLREAVAALVDDGDFAEFTIEAPDGRRAGWRILNASGGLDVRTGYDAGSGWIDTIGAGNSYNPSLHEWLMIYAQAGSQVGCAYYPDNGSGAPDGRFFAGTPASIATGGPLAGFDITAVKMRLAVNSAGSTVNWYGITASTGATEGGGGGATVTDVLVTPSSASLDEGETQQLAAVVNGTGSPSQAVTWSSDDEAVATVDDAGLVTAVGEGSCTITATSVADGTKTDSCAVTVTAAPPPSEFPKNWSASTVVRDAADSPIAGRPLAWRSSDPSIASVTPAGIVTRYQAGACTVYASVRSGTRTVEVGTAVPA